MKTVTLIVTQKENCPIRNTVDDFVLLIDYLGKLQVFLGHRNDSPGAFGTYFALSKCEMPMQYLIG